MVERIKQLLQQQQLSTTQFADLIGVARPVISHVLSERNKPSLEVVQRILAAFPELSMAWLLNGTGPMRANGSGLETTPPVFPVPAPAGPQIVLSSVMAGGIPVAAPAPLLPSLPAPPANVPPVSATAVDETPLNLINSFDASILNGVNAELNFVPFPAPVSASAAVFVAPALLEAMPLRQPTQRFAPTKVAPLAPTTVPRFPVVAATAVAEAAPVAPVMVSAANPVAAPVEPETVVAPVPPVVVASVPVPLVAAPEAPQITAPPAVASVASALPATDKAIRRIVIFYQDGSFSDFAPE